MSYKISCKEMDASCDWEGKADTIVELMRKLQKHLEQDHGKEWSPAIGEYAKRLIVKA